MAKSRESPYTKVCALRRQSSSASLSSLNSSIGLANSTTNSILDNTKRLNQSLDDNTTIHKNNRRTRHETNKAHQSMDESKMLALMEGIEINKEEKIKKESTVATLTNEEIDMENDDVFETEKTSTKQFGSEDYFNFHPSNPFKDDASSPACDELYRIQTGNLPRAFLSSSSTSSPSPVTETSSLETTSLQDPNNATKNKLKYSSAVIAQGSRSIAKLQNKNILANYNDVSNCISNQIANATQMSESVKRVSTNAVNAVATTGCAATGAVSRGGHFKELKERLAASSNRGR